jgi:sugar phosphate isomerase/epimerase
MVSSEGSTARPLSLHHLAMQELTPVELVEVAGASGFDRVCVFVLNPSADQNVEFPLITRNNAGDVRRALVDTGVAIHNLEVFFLTPDVNVNDFRPALELGASLGGRRATAFGLDPDDNRTTDNFARFCELTAEFKIKAGIEFMVFTVVKTLDHAMRIIRGAAHPNGSLALDPLHLIRNGSSPADLAAIGPEMIGYVQFCDGPLTMAPEQGFDEAVYNRLPPGEGAFPLREIVACIPNDRCLSLEVPMTRRREAGMDALARAKLLNAATRRFLSAVDPV